MKVKMVSHFCGIIMISEQTLANSGLLAQVSIVVYAISCAFRLSEVIMTTTYVLEI